MSETESAGASGTAQYVRAARPSDAEFIGKLQAQTMLDLLAVVSPGREWPEVSAEAMVEEWVKTLSGPALDDAGTLVAEDGGAVGFASYAVHPTGQTVEVLALEVQEYHRLRGHGSRLLSAVADLTRSAGHAGLQTWVFPEESAKVRFFQSAGFGSAGARRRLDAGSTELIQHLWHTALEDQKARIVQPAVHPGNMAN